jgi:hypothetical protein
MPAMQAVHLAISAVPRVIGASQAGARDFAGLDPLPPDLLFREELQLEAAFYHQDHLDPREWESLAARFERAGRPHRAQATREKLRGRLQILIGKLNQEAQALEDAFYQESRLDPAEWERLAARFDRLNRTHRLAQARAKLRRLQLIQANQAPLFATLSPDLAHAASKTPRNSPHTTAVQSAAAIIGPHPSSDTPPRL